METFIALAFLLAIGLALLAVLGLLTASTAKASRKQQRAAWDSYREWRDSAPAGLSRSGDRVPS